MANGAKVTLGENVSAGNQTAALWPGGAGVFIAEATWGGGSAKLQFQTPQGTWVDYPSGSMSANGLIAFTLPPTQVRMVTATATAAYGWAIRTG